MSSNRYQDDLAAGMSRRDARQAALARARAAMTQREAERQRTTHCPVCGVFLTPANKLQIAAGGQVCFHR